MYIYKATQNFTIQHIVFLLMYNPKDLRNIIQTPERCLNRHFLFWVDYVNGLFRLKTKV